MNSSQTLTVGNNFVSKNKKNETVDPDLINIHLQNRVSSPAEKPREVMRDSIIRELKNNGSLDDFLSDAYISQLAGRLMWASIKALQPEVIVALGLSAMPLLYAIAIAADEDKHTVQVLMIRSKRKQHNQKKWVEGKRISPGAPAVFINDFFADADTLSVVEQALNADDHLLQFKATALLLDVTAFGGFEYSSLQEAPLLSLFDASEFSKYADALKTQIPRLISQRKVFPLQRDSVATMRIRKSVRLFAQTRNKITFIPKIAAPSASEFQKIVKDGMPAVITGFVEDWPLSKLTPATLKELHGNLRVYTVDGYVERPFSAERIKTETSLADYLASIEELSSPFPPYVSNQKIPALSAMCEWPDIYQKNKDTKIWLGPKNTITPLHCDFEDNFFAQIWGQKQFTLYPPNDDEFLYTWQVNPALFGSRFDPMSPDYRACPLAKKATPISYILKPGELLFLPAGWFHHVRALELSLSVNRWGSEVPMAVKQ